jgi:predicted nucleic acid-binding protein
MCRPRVRRNYNRALVSAAGRGKAAILEIEINRNPDADRRHDVAALYLACAEEGRADVFLTTDDNLVRRAGRRIDEIRTRVMNPVSWYQEVAL